MTHPTDELTARINPIVFDAVNLATRKALATLIDAGKIDIGSHLSQARGLHLDPQIVVTPSTNYDAELLQALGVTRAKPGKAITLWLNDSRTVLSEVKDYLDANKPQSEILLRAIDIKDRIRQSPDEREALVKELLALRETINKLNAEAGTVE